MPTDPVDWISKHWTAVIALYSAILSTFNFLREQRKDRITLTITAKNALLSHSKSTAFVKSITVINNSHFEIEITSVGFSLDSKYNLVFMPNIEDFYKIPDDISPKKSRDYPIFLERIQSSLSLHGIHGKIRMKPFVMVNGKNFYGKPFFFDSVLPSS